MYVISRGYTIWLLSHWKTMLVGDCQTRWDGMGWDESFSWDRMEVGTSIQATLARQMDRQTDS